MDLKKTQWDKSYQHGDNYVFYPHEEIIRFISSYLKKRVGINSFKVIKDAEKGLDLGCGIGRHVFLMEEYGFKSFGVDLSESAISYAKKWSIERGLSHLVDSFIVASATQLPFSDEEFDFILSHGVLDSMSFDIALEVMSEAFRILKNEGLFYLDLIAGDTNHELGEDGEYIVNTEHEKNTVQSYFNLDKINKLIKNNFTILNCYLCTEKSIINNYINHRYHIVLQKK